MVIVSFALNLKKTWIDSSTRWHQLPEFGDSFLYQLKECTQLTKSVQIENSTYSSGLWCSFKTCVHWYKVKYAHLFEQKWSHFCEWVFTEFHQNRINNFAVEEIRWYAWYSFRRFRAFEYLQKFTLLHKNIGFVETKKYVFKFNVAHQAVQSKYSNIFNYYYHLIVCKQYFSDKKTENEKVTKSASQCKYSLSTDITIEKNSWRICEKYSNRPLTWICYFNRQIDDNKFNWIYNQSWLWTHSSFMNTCSFMKKHLIHECYYDVHSIVHKQKMCP